MITVLPSCRANGDSDAKKISTSTKNKEEEASGEGADGGDEEVEWDNDDDLDSDRTDTKKENARDSSLAGKQGQKQKGNWGASDDSYSGSEEL